MIEAPKPAGSLTTLQSVSTQKLQQDLKRLEGEWGIFNDPRIKLGSKIQRTSAFVAAGRYLVKNPKATFQLVITRTFEKIKKVNSVKSANYLKQELLNIIQETADKCGIALQFVVEAESEEFEMIETRSLAKLAQDTFRFFSQSRRHFPVLSETFALEKDSDYRTAYISAYDVISKEADRVCKDLMARFLAKVSQGQLSSQIDINKAAERFKAVCAEPKNLDAKAFHLLDQAIHEFFQSAYTLNDKLIEIEAIFNSSTIPEGDIALLEVQKCRDLRAIVSEFVMQMYETTEEPLKQLYEDPSPTNLDLFAKALEAAFLSDIGQAFIAELMNRNSTLTMERIAAIDKRFIFYLPDGANINKTPCWQSCLFQAATSRLTMPLGEMLNQLTSQVPQETLNPLIKVYQQLSSIAVVSQALSPGVRKN